ncbi:MAG TPA: START-like domain-containing protein [Bacteroidales bacterium]|nr:START-like domain-containing protein [Bacteroidales bacterium]
MNQKIELEYTFNTSAKVLYNRLSTPAGLSEWFADDVNLKNNNFTFVWDGSEQIAELVSKRDNKHIRFKWKDSDDDCYFEFKIQKDELTGDLALMITDFADNEDDKSDAIDLWDSQISELKHAIGL